MHTRAAKKGKSCFGKTAKAVDRKAVTLKFHMAYGLKSWMENRRPLLHPAFLLLLARTAARTAASAGTFAVTGAPAAAQTFAVNLGMIFFHFQLML